MNFFESNEKNLKKDDGIYGDPSDPYSPYVSESSSSSKFDIRNFSIYGNLNYLINESTKFSMGPSKLISLNSITLFDIL